MFAASCSIVPQVGVGVRKAEPDVRERRFGEDERRQQQRRLHGEVAARRRQQVANQDRASGRRRPRGPAVA